MEVQLCLLLRHDRPDTFELVFLQCRGHQPVIFQNAVPLDHPRPVQSSRRESLHQNSQRSLRQTQRYLARGLQKADRIYVRSRTVRAILGGSEHNVKLSEHFHKHR